MHEEELDLVGVVDEEALVAVGHDVTGLLVGSVSDVGHGELALEERSAGGRLSGRTACMGGGGGQRATNLKTTANAVINTLGLAPCLLKPSVAVTLVAPVGVGVAGESRGRVVEESAAATEGRAREEEEGGKGRKIISSPSRSNPPSSSSTTYLKGLGEGQLVSFRFPARRPRDGSRTWSSCGSWRWKRA